VCRLVTICRRGRLNGLRVLIAVRRGPGIAAEFRKRIVLADQSRQFR
jgi:hypothetical protein